MAEGGRGAADDLTEMAKSMAKTFDTRRNEVLEKNLGVDKALVCYPGLKNFEELRREFERITGKSVKDFELHLNCVLKTYAKKQIGMEYSSCTSNYCKESLEILRQDGEDNARKAAARVILYACAQSTTPWWDVAVKVTEKKGEIRLGRLQPTVLVRGSPFEENCASVFCEKLKVVGSVNFFEAILACYFLYYIFNIELPPVDAEVFKAFEKVLNLMGSVEEKGEGTSSTAKKN